MLCTLSACTQSADARIDELDARVTVDCGGVSECMPRAQADAVVACMRESLAAGVEAKAGFTLDIDRSEYVYAHDGRYIVVSFNALTGSQFEMICRDVEVPGTDATCTKAQSIDCELVREWND
jgi:hypothetical protein